MNVFICENGKKPTSSCTFDSLCFFAGRKRAVHPLCQTVECRLYTSKCVFFSHAVCRASRSRRLLLLFYIFMVYATQSLLSPLHSGHRYIIDQFIERKKNRLISHTMKMKSTKRWLCRKWAFFVWSEFSCGLRLARRVGDNKIYIDRIDKIVHT